jgi:signal transduction histidine kinase
MRLSTQFLLAFLLVLLLSTFDTGSNYLLSLKVERNSQFLSNSQEIIRHSTSLHKSIIDMQSSFRGYLLTNDDQFLDSYQAGAGAVPQLINELKKLITSSPIQLRLIDTIDNLHHQWLQYALGLINAKKNFDSKESIEKYNILFESQLKKQVGKKINDDIAKIFNEFDRIEYNSRSVHSSNLAKSIRDTHTFSLIFFLSTIVIGICTAWFIVHRLSNRIKTMVLLAENISQGRFTSLEDNKNDELKSLSTSLNKMSASLQKNISELENRNAELDKFAYAVSHDLKAPIRGINNVVNWIEEDHGDELSSPVKKNLDIIRNRTKRMEDLINGLLDYARVRNKTSPQITNVNEIVYHTIDGIVPRSFKVDVHDLPVFSTEKLKLEQVFENLISNAVKYTSNKDGHIIVSCNEHPGYYEFSVKDNGIGIDPEYHSKIFEMFQTLRNKDEQESTGIGLALIKKILDDQNCTIRVESTIGNGAEFIFTWPKNLN